MLKVAVIMKDLALFVHNVTCSQDVSFFDKGFLKVYTAEKNLYYYSLDEIRRFTIKPEEEK